MWMCVSVCVCDGGVRCPNPRRNLDDRLLLAVCVLHSIFLPFFLQDCLPVSRLNPISQHIHIHINLQHVKYFTHGFMRENYIHFFNFLSSVRVERVKNDGVGSLGFFNHTGEVVSAA